jgi:hypothetical protein
MSRKRPTTQTDPTPDAPDAPEQTDVQTDVQTDPTPDAPDTEQTDGDAPDPTPADRRDTFRTLFVGAVDAGATDPTDDLGAALVAVGGPSKREQVRSAVVTEVTTTALTATPPDVERATVAATLGSALAASVSAKAVEQGPDPVEVARDRVVALAMLTADLLAHADGLDGDLPSDLLDVARPFAALTGSDPSATEEAFSKAFGRKVPDVTKVRGGGGGGGGGRKRPTDALDALPTGPVHLTYHGDRIDADIVSDADGRHRIRHDGTVYPSVTTAANAAIATHPKAPDTPSHNGWAVWTLDDGTSIGDAYDGLNQD